MSQKLKVKITKKANYKPYAFREQRGKTSAHAPPLLMFALRTWCQVFRRLLKTQNGATSMFCLFCENASGIINVTT